MKASSFESFVLTILLPNKSNNSAITSEFFNDNVKSCRSSILNEFFVGLGKILYTFSFESTFAILP